MPRLISRFRVSHHVCGMCVCMHANVRISVCSVWLRKIIFCIICIYDFMYVFQLHGIFFWVLFHLVSLHSCKRKAVFYSVTGFGQFAETYQFQISPLFTFRHIFRTDSVQLYSHIGKVQKLRHALLLYMFCDSCRVKYIMFYFVFSFWFFFSQRMQKVSSFKAFSFILFEVTFLWSLISWHLHLYSVLLAFEFW